MANNAFAKINLQNVLLPVSPNAQKKNTLEMTEPVLKSG